MKKINILIIIPIIIFLFSSCDSILKSSEADIAAITGEGFIGNAVIDSTEEKN